MKGSLAVASLSVAALMLLPHCKTTSGAGPTVAVTCSSLKALGDTFLLTGGALDAAFDAKILTPKDYLPWHDFSLRFQAAYAIADKACEQALKTDDQSVQGVLGAEMTLFQTQMADFVTLAAKIANPNSKSDGGVP